MQYDNISTILEISQRELMRKLNNLSQELKQCKNKLKQKTKDIKKDKTIEYDLKHNINTTNVYINKHMPSVYNAYIKKYVPGNFYIKLYKLN